MIGRYIDYFERQDTKDESPEKRCTAGFWPFWRRRVKDENLRSGIKKFRKFVDEKLSFHDGINVVWAKNGAGKSTIHEFILAMFYGLKGEECIRWQSWNGNGCLSGKLRFESGGKTYLLERDFLDGKNKGHLHCETDDQELSVEEDLPELLGNMSENAAEKYALCDAARA